jgi:hypothetical protein
VATAPHTDADGVSWLDDEPEPPPVFARHGKPASARHGHLVAVGLVATGLVLVLTARLHTDRQRPEPVPSPPPTFGLAVPGPVVVDRFSTFDAEARWELFVRGDAEIIRVEPAFGRITRTPLPALQSFAPVALIAGYGEVVVRPLDRVPGYAVPDGRAPQPLPGLLAEEGPALPGPRPGQLWAPSADRRGMELVGPDGLPIGVFVPLGDSRRPGADGAGGLLLHTPRGTFDVAPGRNRLVTTGDVIAVGPTRMLARECADARCELVVITQATGARRTLAAHGLDGDWTGVISPDGGRVAYPNPVTAQVHVLDLSTGADLATATSANLFLTADAALAWLPGGQMLAVIEADRGVGLLDAVSGGRTDFWVPLGPAYQLAVRTL